MTGMRRAEVEASGSIRLDHAGHLAVITISRPGKHNSLSVDMWQALRDTALALDTDRRVRVVVVRGEGRAAFSTGADISEFGAVRSSAGDAERYAELLEATELALVRMRKPVIGMLHGLCVGGGAGIALSCAVRFADEALRFSIPAAKLGVVYHQTAVDRLVHSLGPMVASDILISGRELDAAEALARGLVVRVLPADVLEEAVHEYAQTIASRAPLAVAGGLVGVRLALEPANPDLRREIARLQREAIESEDYREGVNAFVERRRPHFGGR